jgi:hypothetical protein
MSVLAIVRPGEWEFPLFVHVLGGMALVGSLVLAITYLVPAWRGGSAQTLLLGFKALLYGALPSYLVLRISAEWIADKEGISDLPDDQIPDWIDIGYITADAGLLFLLISLIAGGIAVRRARGVEGDSGATAVRIATVLVSILIVAYLVAIWAMTTKPGG